MDHLKQLGDGISLGLVVATITQWLPAVAAVFSIIWTAIRIYETKTVQNLLHRLARKKRS